MKAHPPIPLSQTDMLTIWNLTGQLLVFHLNSIERGQPVPDDLYTSAFAAAISAYMGVSATARGAEGVDLKGTPYRFRIGASGESLLEMHPQLRPANK